MIEITLQTIVTNRIPVTIAVRMKQTRTMGSYNFIRILTSKIRTPSNAVKVAETLEAFCVIIKGHK